jgi:hypothetical protein
VIIRGPLLAPVGQAVPDNQLSQAQPDLQVLAVRPTREPLARGFVRAEYFFFFSVGLYSASVASPRVYKLLTSPKLASEGEANLVGLRLGVRALFTRG